MKVLTSKTLYSTALIAAIGMCSAGPSHAQGTQLFKLTGIPDTKQVTISYNGGSTWVTGAAGRYSATLTGNSGTQAVSVFCVDPAHDINVGDTYQAYTAELITAAPTSTLTSVTSGASTYNYYAGGLGSEMTTSDSNPAQNPALTNAQKLTRESEVAYLADNYLGASASTFTAGLSGSTDFNTNMAAVNMSIWDIVEDGGAKYGAGSNQVLFSGDGNLIGDTTTANNFNGLVNYYDSLAASHGTYASTTAYWIQAPVNANGAATSQTYVFKLTPTGAPEPSPAIVMCIGLGALGIVVYIRRKRPAADQA